MQAMADACLPGGELSELVEPVGVISSRQSVGGITKAQELGIPVVVIPRRDYKPDDAGTAAYGEALLSALKKFAPDIVTLNGFLARVSPAVIEAYRQGIFNQHPGPVPDFGGGGMYGRRVHAAVLIFNRLTARTDPYTTVVAQLVDPCFDQGETVGFRTVPIQKNDTVDLLAQRTLPVEHQVQIRLLKDYADGQIYPAKPEEYVRRGEEVILYLAKETGKALYPNG